jgi:hypothetical protein
MIGGMLIISVSPVALAQMSMAFIANASVFFQALLSLAL